MYPENDKQFVEYVVTGVEARKDGTFVINCDGWSLWCGDDCKIEPKVRQTARLYGKGLGAVVRGLFVGDVKYWYRTESEQAEYHEITMYGADAADWLSRWDAGKSVWSIEMGGLGPGYEQCIQMTAAEVLRWLLTNKTDADLWKDKDVWKQTRDAIDKSLWANPTIDKLGLSGAQAGAAVSLATALYRQGPRKIMNDPKVKDRHIQVQRDFPGMVAA